VSADTPYAAAANVMTRAFPSARSVPWLLSRKDGIALVRCGNFFILTDVSCRLKRGPEGWAAIGGATCCDQKVVRVAGAPLADEINGLDLEKGKGSGIAVRRLRAAHRRPLPACRKNAQRQPSTLVGSGSSDLCSFGSSDRAASIMASSASLAGALQGR
jgi:hypothetical protein